MPSHQMEGEDYKAGSGALTGERIFGDADPATALRQYQANALWHGLRTLLKGEEVAGDLTADSGAADQAEGYIRLAKAIRRAIRRFQPSNLTNITINSGNVVFTPSQDVFVYHLVDPGSPASPQAADSFVHPSIGTEQKNRLILIVNMTANYRLVGNSYYQKYVRLAPRESCWFYGFDESGSGSVIWQAIGRAFDEPTWKTLSCKLYAGSVQSSAFDVRYLRSTSGKLVTLHIPFTPQITFAGSPSEILIVDSIGGNFPSDMRLNDTLDGAPNNIATPVHGIINDVPVMMIGVFSTQRISLTRFDLGALSNGQTFRTYGFQWSYFGNP